jgi:3-oxoacyl-[acyl-carrier protein] reductase
MDLGLAGRVAMVAASSKGIGRAIATSLLAEGCRVSICARTADEIEAAREEMAAAAPITEVFGSRCDVTSAEDLSAWYAATVERFRKVDILVTNSGGPPAARFFDLTEEKWREGIDIVLFNVLRLSRLVLPGMRERKWGRIIHVSSFVAKQPTALLTISSTLRAGLSALTKTMSNEFCKDGVLVNTVLPGYVLTDRQKHLNEIRSKEEGISLEAYTARTAATIPLGRSGRPEEIGDVVAFLASERASYITGATIQVDGGLIQSTF